MMKWKVNIHLPQHSEFLLALYSALPGHETKS